MTLKRTQVMLLPTNEKTNVGSIVTRPSDNKIAIVNVLTKNDPQPCIHQHLYFLSDEEIKENDWRYNTYSKSLIPPKTKTEGGLSKFDKKIIATTNSSLEIVSKGINPVYEKLPSPSQDFIKVFVEEYNKGNVIEWVDVEYIDNGQEEWMGDDYNGEPFWNEKLDLKVSSKNEITIRKIKDSWNRDEVVELLSKHFVDAGSKIGLGNNVTEFTKKWIAENL